MMDESQFITIETLWKLETWACAWFDEALEAKFISTSYSPDAATLDLLRGYFRAGLSPAEAAQACFGGRH